jgi:1-acyl-sn-glycerol-3-phosphate acyltransferase
MGYIIKIGKVIFTLYAFILFVAFLLIIFPLVVIATFFGRIRGGNMIYSLCRFWADCIFPLIFISTKIIYESPHNRSKPYVFVFNHISYADIPVIMKAIRRQPIRILAKSALGKIPVFGFLYRNATIMVDRDNAVNRAKSVVLLKRVLKKNISILISPEGTFNTTQKPLKEFYDGAFRIAIETQTPIKPILFLDMYERMNYHSFFSLTPGKCRIVYLAEIETLGLTLKDTEALKQQVYKLMEDGLARYRGV